MKKSAAKIAEAVAWVERNGLYPQACGAPVKDFCAAMGISDETYRRWSKNVEFVEALNRAREIFQVNTVRDVENALVKAARGVDFTREKSEAKAETIKEYDPKTGKKVKEYLGEPKVVKAVRETIYYPPNVEAAKFVLSNMAPDRWRLKQDVNIGTQEGKPIDIAVSSAQAADDIRRVIDAGAQPAPPKDEE